MPFRRSLRVTLLALLTVGVTLVASATASADTPYNDPLTRVSSSNFGLVWHPVTAATTANLDSKMNNVGVTEVLESANHPTRACNSAEAETLPTAPTAGTSFCWDTGDAATEDWHPQSITSSGDADDDGAWGTNKLLLAGWSYVAAGTDEHPHNTVRVAFIDYNNPSAPKYRWVLLVTPISGGEDFKAIQAHAGGISWYGDKLFVSGQQGDNNGLYVFSMQHILQASVNGSDVGKVDGGYSAWGYQYVMPAIGSYGYDTTCSGGVNTGTPCFDTISLDRASVPNSLVTAEYLNNGTKARLVRYDFGSDYLLGGSSAGGAGTEVSANEALLSGVGNIQGVLAHDSTWYTVHASDTSGVHGHLWRQTTGSPSVATCGGTYQCWAEHGGALSLWQNTGMVWSLTEWPNLRVVFAVPLTSLP